MAYAIRKTITGAEIRRLRSGMKKSRKDFAELLNISEKTLIRWELAKEPVGGPAVTLLKLISERPDLVQALEVPERTYPLRLWYMQGDEPCTVIDADERHRLVKIRNFTRDYMRCAFGRQEEPTYEDFEAWLESRCFPRSGDKMKLRLRELNLPFYDPMMIIEKTQGHMAEDTFWVKIERE